MYAKDIKEKLDRELQKLEKRNPELIRALDKKIEEILANPHRYKPFLEKILTVFLGNEVRMLNSINYILFSYSSLLKPFLCVMSKKYFH
jgi:hypothetical protein